MSFTLNVWKEKAAGGLRQAGDWLERRKTRDAPQLLYGALCGLSLWPLVEAAQAGELLPVMMALGGVAGGVGGNLIAEQLQRWKDRADESQVAEWVIEHAPDDADLRDALDDILEKLDAVAQAQAGLSERDRAWFSETLREELAQLGNLARFEGVIAQGPGARAVGQVCVWVEGNVGGDVVTGTKSTIFDQRDQSTGPQVNVGRDWNREQ